MLHTSERVVRKGLVIKYGLETIEERGVNSSGLVRHITTPFFHIDGQEVMPQELRDAWQQGRYMEAAHEYVEREYPAEIG